MGKRRIKPVGTTTRSKGRKSNTPQWPRLPDPVEVPFPKPLGGRKGPSRSEKNLEVYGDIKVYKTPDLEEAE